MTNPSDETAETSPVPPAEGAAPAAGHAEPPPAVAPPAAQGAPYADPHGAPYGPAYGVPYAAAPFAPVPRMPWINPARRTQAVLIAAGTALVLLFGGFAVGFAAGHHRGERGRFGPVDGRGMLRPDLRQYGGPGGQQQPGYPQFGPRPNRGPSPVPSASPSSSRSS